MVWPDWSLPHILPQIYATDGYGYVAGRPGSTPEGMCYPVMSNEAKTPRPYSWGHGQVIQAKANVKKPHIDTSE